MGHKLSKMLVEESNRRILTVDRHTGMCVSLMSSTRGRLSTLGATRRQTTSSQFGSPIPGEMLANRVADHMHYYTCGWYIRPFGAAVLVASYTEEGGPMLYAAEPSGVSYRFFATAIGKNACKSALEKLDLEKLTCREGARAPLGAPRWPPRPALNSPFTRAAVIEIAKISHSMAQHDPAKAKPIELELSWVCDATAPPAQARPARASRSRRGGRGGARGDGRRLARRCAPVAARR